jgi:hypothetical protein
MKEQAQHSRSGRRVGGANVTVENEMALAGCAMGDVTDP